MNEWMDIWNKCFSLSPIFCDFQIPIINKHSFSDEEKKKRKKCIEFSIIYSKKLFLFPQTLLDLPFLISRKYLYLSLDPGFYHPNTVTIVYISCSPHPRCHLRSLSVRLIKCQRRTNLKIIRSKQRCDLSKLNSKQ